MRFSIVIPVYNREHWAEEAMCLKVGTQGPCVVVKQPVTVAYREHLNNAHKDLGANTKAVRSLIEHEREGQYPGGQDRRRDRYIWIGSVALHWTPKWVEAAKPWYLLWLLPHGAPMLAGAPVAKIKTKFLRWPSFPGIRYSGRMGLPPTVHETQKMVHN